MCKTAVRSIFMAGVLVVVLIGCASPSVLNTPAPMIPPGIKMNTSPTSANPVPFPAVRTPGDSGDYYGVVQIIGSPDFVRQTWQALALLETEAPGAYQKDQTYIGIIKQGQHSGMWAAEKPPRYEVGDRTAFYSVTWYASTIAHDATHSELYHNGQQWQGMSVEKFCNAYQLAVLKKIGAPDNEVIYLAGQNGNHCDVDGDGDCDWQDYEKRDW